MSHWYLNGEAWHFQPDGKPTTLRHARKHLKETGEAPLPSVTEIIGLLNAPALTNWKLKRVTESMYENQNEFGLWEGSYEHYHNFILNEALGPDVTGVDRGSLIHDAIENWFMRPQSGETFPNDIQEIAIAACNNMMAYCGGIEEDFFCEQIVVGDGYAGKVDAYNDEFVIDWKTKDITDTSKKLAYPNHAMQLAAYDSALDKRIAGITRPRRRCLNVFIDRTEPKVVIHEWKPEEIETAWKKFELLLKYWQLDKGYPE